MGTPADCTCIVSKKVLSARPFCQSTAGAGVVISHLKKTPSASLFLFFFQKKHTSAFFPHYFMTCGRSDCVGHERRRDDDQMESHPGSLEPS